MNKTDNRHYNRTANRNLSIEMNIWCIIGGKLFEARGCIFDNKPVYGKVINLKYQPHSKGNLCRIYLDNGTEYALKIKYGKIVPEAKITIL